MSVFGTAGKHHDKSITFIYSIVCICSKHLPATLALFFFCCQNHFGSASYTGVYRCCGGQTSLYIPWHALGAQHVSDYNIFQFGINSIACSEISSYTFFSESLSPSLGHTENTQITVMLGIQVCLLLYSRFMSRNPFIHFVLFPSPTYLLYIFLVNGSQTYLDLLPRPEKCYEKSHAAWRLVLSLLLLPPHFYRMYTHSLSLSLPRQCGKIDEKMHIIAVIQYIFLASPKFHSRQRRRTPAWSLIQLFLSVLLAECLSLTWNLVNIPSC